MWLPMAECMVYAKSMGVAPAGRLITSPLGVNTNTSSANISTFSEWMKSSASASS